MADGKACSRCGERKPFGEYYRNAASPDGFYSICKLCRKPLTQEYHGRPEVVERERQRLAKAYQDNRDTILANHKKRRSAQPEIEKARRDAYLSSPEKREEQRARCRAWAKQHPDAMRHIVRKRRATRLGADGSHIPADIERLYAAQHGRCVYCNDTLGDAYHVDHIHPLSRGGSNGPENLQLTCHLCNRMKGAKINWQFDRERYESLRASQ